jgi:hypothetical protein
VTTKARASFVHDFVYVRAPLETVKHRVVSSEEWMSTLAARAYEDGERLRLRLGPGGVGLSKRVEMTLGSPIARQDAVVIPLRWEATGAPGLFPVMEADLEIAPFGPDVTQVSFSGRYEPPLGAIGHAADQLLLHHVAEACVRSFLRRLGDAVGASVTAP